MASISVASDFCVYLFRGPALSLRYGRAYNEITFLICLTQNCSPISGHKIWWKKIHKTKKVAKCLEKLVNHFKIDLFCRTNSFSILCEQYHVLSLRHCHRRKKKPVADYFLDEKDLRDSGLSNLFEWIHLVGFDRVVKK